jgi:hypothetical protein
VNHTSRDNPGVEFTCEELAESIGSTPREVAGALRYFEPAGFLLAAEGAWDGDLGATIGWLLTIPDSACKPRRLRRRRVAK